METIRDKWRRQMETIVYIQTETKGDVVQLEALLAVFAA
jgi:hypothetical protein